MELNAITATRLVAEVAEDSSRVFFTVHAEERMAQRGIIRTQVGRCLKYGRIVEGPYRDTSGCWKVRMRVLSAGDVVSVVAALDWREERGSYVVIITAWC